MHRTAKLTENATGTREVKNDAGRVREKKGRPGQLTRDMNRSNDRKSLEQISWFPLKKNPIQCNDEVLQIEVTWSKIRHRRKRLSGSDFTRFK
jgi:hypothetical protein